MLLVVDQLHRRRILVQSSSAERLAVARDDPDRPVDRDHRLGWLQKRSLERSGLPDGADVAQVWRDPRAEFTRDFVTINASAARWCVARRVKLVGIDYLSIEPQGPEKAGYPVHHTLLGAGVVIIEGLDLRGVAAGAYELVCAPVKIAGGDGAPARVFLIER